MPPTLALVALGVALVLFAAASSSAATAVGALIPVVSPAIALVALDVALVLPAAATPTAAPTLVADDCLLRLPLGVASAASPTASPASTTAHHKLLHDTVCLETMGGRGCPPLSCQCWPGRCCRRQAVTCPLMLLRLFLTLCLGHRGIHAPELPGPNDIVQEGAVVEPAEASQIKGSGWRFVMDLVFSSPPPPDLPSPVVIG